MVVIMGRTADLSIIDPANQRDQRAPTYSYKVVRSFPHDRQAYTQGLVYLDGFLYERGPACTGSRTFARSASRPARCCRSGGSTPKYFGEGLAVVGSNLIQLTWQTEVGFRLRPRDVRPQAHVRPTQERVGD